jgi:hypothetical protein
MVARPDFPPPASSSRTGQPPAEPFDEEAWLNERWRLFHLVVAGFFALVTVVFALILWVAASPDTYHEHEAALQRRQIAEAPRWPDGSQRDADAQQAEAPAPR